MADDSRQPGDLIGKKEIAKIVGATPRTVQRWDDEGLLPPPSFQVGLFKRWTRERIAMWIQLGGTPLQRPRKKRQNTGSSGEGDDKEPEKQPPRLMG